MNEQTGGSGRRADDPAGVRFYLIAHTHWDREWYLPFERFRDRLARMLDGLMVILNEDASYKSFHLDGQTIVLEDYEEIRGESAELRELIKQGRIRIGPWYVLPDEFLVSGESLIRNLERGLALCRRFGAQPPAVGYLPDMFGHVAQMPQVLAGFGMTSAAAWRGVPATVTGHKFIWKAPDGTGLLTAYLPLGYGYASALPRAPELLAERLDNLLRETGTGDTGGAALLLNGSDHVPPQPFAASALTEACGLRPGWSWEFGDWDGWIKTLRDSGPAGAVHAGEMRSSERTLILPSVASARLYLKQMDFALTSTLERYAEPLAALARALGGEDLSGRLDYAWKLALQNHPHDSICGCSVDEVHDEMETRYRKAQQVADRVTAAGLHTILQQAAPRGPALAVYNPAGETAPGIITGIIDARLKPGLALARPDGSASPLQALSTLAPEKTLLDWRMDREIALMVMNDLIVAEQFGLHVQTAEVKVVKGMLDVRLDAGSLPAGFEAGPARAQAERALADPAVKDARVRVKRLPRQRVAAVVDRLPGYAVTTFELRKSKAPAQPAVVIGPDFMENERVKVLFEPGGTCLLTDKERDVGYRCLRFLDVADRGDSYNFDPLPDEAIICEMDKVALKSVATGPAAAVMEIRHRLRLPESLHAGRKVRSRKHVLLDLATSVTVYRGSARVDFRTRFLNTARDHRLQVAVRAPFPSDTIRVESPFALVARPVAEMAPPNPGRPRGLAFRLLGDEGVYTTSPQKTVALISHGGRGLAVMNRGLAEVEARRLEGATRVALTLVRSVGWLSRGDLGMRRGDAGPMLAAPGAQCLRQFEYEYAVLPYDAAADEARILAAAHTFAYPPLPLPPAAGPGPGGMTIARLDNPLVYLSAIRPRDNGEVELRVVNASARAQAFRLEWGPWWSGGRLTDLKGDTAAVPDATLTDRELQAELRPHGILTVRLRPAGGRE